MLTIPALTSELQADPLALGYAALITADNWSGLVALLNDRTKGYTIVVPMLATARTVMQAMGPTGGAAALDALQAAAGSNSAIKWAMQFITGSGIDLGDPVTRATVNALVPSVLTSAQAAALLAIANAAASRVEVLFGQGTTVAQGDVVSAVFTDAGARRF